MKEGSNEETPGSCVIQLKESSNEGRAQVGRGHLRCPLRLGIEALWMDVVRLDMVVSKVSWALATT